MDINEALALLESDYVENDIEALTPKDRLNFWAQLKEFQQPKIMRQPLAPDEQSDTEFTIIYAGSRNTNRT